MTAPIEGPRADAQVTVIEVAPPDAGEFLLGGVDYESLSDAGREYVDRVDPGWGAEAFDDHESLVAAANADEAQV